MFLHYHCFYLYSRLRQLGQAHVDPNADQEEESGRRISSNQSNAGNDPDDEERIYEQVQEFLFSSCLKAT